MGERNATPLPVAAPGPLTGSTLGGFELLSLLGAGGMAEVYRGYDRSLHREVAVKVLPEGMARDPRYVARFHSEAQAVAALSHPSIVPVFQFGEERGRLYLVMPVYKESLRQRMMREGILDPVEAVALCMEVADALDATHRQGLAHRDVKPENILLNDEGRPLLGDFGIAREVDALRDPTAPRTLAESGLPIGTPEYMAPEQLRGGPADQRVDVYGLGAVLYELLTGRVPHEGLTIYDVVARTLTEAPQSPAIYNPTLWPALADVALGAVASNPDQRYPDMASLMEALRQALLDRSARAPTNASASLTSLVVEPPGPPDLPFGEPANGAQRDEWGLFGPARDSAMQRSAMTRNLRQRRDQRLMTMVSITLALVALALGGVGAGRALYASYATAGAPRTAITPMSATPIIVSTTTSGISPGGSRTPTAAATVGPSVTATLASAPTTVPVPVPTATPLLTPTIVVSASPLAFQPYPPAPQKPTNCVATQKLTNLSAVDAVWSWSNAPAPTGWQYSTTGLSDQWHTFPETLTVTTPAYSSVYVYIKAGVDTTPAGPCTKLSTVATITVMGGTGTTFDVSY